MSYTDYRPYELTIREKQLSNRKVISYVSSKVQIYNSYELERNFPYDACVKTKNFVILTPNHKIKRTVQLKEDCKLKEKTFPDIFQ